MLKQMDLLERLMCPDFCFTLKWPLLRLKFQPEQELMGRLVENDICNQLPHDSVHCISVCMGLLDSF